MARRLKKANAAAVYKALRKKFGASSAYTKKDPVDHIVFSILLSGTTPEKAQKAFAALKSTYVDWNEVRVTSTRETSSVIESKGCVAKRSESIKTFLQRLFFDNHTVSTQPIQKMSTKRAKEYVEETTGLPSEQVATILLEVFDIPVVPINKQIKYALVRLGLVKMGSSPRQVQKTFLRLASEGKAATAYRVLYILSTEHCREDEQLCAGCPVKKHCPTGQERIREIREARRSTPADGKKKIVKRSKRSTSAKKKK